MDTGVLWVEWLEEECARAEVIGLSPRGCEACVFCAKSHMTCDFVRTLFMYYDVV